MVPDLLALRKDRMKPDPATSFSDREVQLWHIPLFVPQEHRTTAESLLSEEERAHMTRLATPSRRASFLASRAALRLILSRNLNLSPSELNLIQGPTGKPALLSPSPVQIHFNLSHSKDLCLFAVCQHMELGIDVEYIRPNVDCEKIARRFFAQSEVLSLSQADPPWNPTAFFRIWTRKEALLKGLGGSITDLFHRNNPSLENTGWSILSLQLGQGYVGALATDPGLNKITYLEFSWTEPYSRGGFWHSKEN